MELFLEIKEGVNLELCEIKEKLLQTLDVSGIEYRVPFDKVNAHNIKETIIQMPKLGVEVSVENDIVVYIKTRCTEFSKMAEFKIGTTTGIDIVDDIKQKIMCMYSIEKKNMHIQTLNIKSMEVIIIVDTELGKRRIHILSNAMGEVYINTIAVIR